MAGALGGPLPQAQSARERDGGKLAAVIGFAAMGGAAQGVHLSPPSSWRVMKRQFSATTTVHMCRWRKGRCAGSQQQ